jgi:GDP-D-mannose 3', 5'-epimerase
MEYAVVCGAGGFIAHHLVKRLKADGYWVRGVDVKKPEFAPTAADEFVLLDLRDMDQARRALAPAGAHKITEVYQLAAEMGGMGFISTAECEIMRHSTLINLNVPQAAVDAGVARYFLSSSVCVYRDMAVGEPELTEDGAYPAQPDNEYGWEKLYAERVLQAYARNRGLTARIARFQNCYGPEAPGPADARRRRPLSAAKSRTPKTAASSKCGGTVPQSGRTSMSTISSTASCG